MTREEAIICLKGIKNYGRDTFNEQSDWQGCLDMAIKALENEPKWIPVSERLPEYRREVLTCSDGGYIEIQSCESTYTYWENALGDWSAIDEVVAWMPLPDPYEAESDEV